MAKELSDTEVMTPAPQELSDAEVMKPPGREGGILQTIPEFVHELATPAEREPLLKRAVSALQPLGQTANPKLNVIYGMVSPFWEPFKKAATQGLTPEEETSFGLNAALLELGIKSPFSKPAVKVAHPAVQEFNDKVLVPTAERLDSYGKTGDPNGVRLDPPGPGTKLDILSAVQGSPVASVPTSVAAQTGDPVIDSILNHPTMKAVIDNPVVDRSHTIPYEAGGSVPLNRPTTYVDKHVPQTFTVRSLSDPKKTITFDTAEPTIIHENTEEMAMDILTKYGMKTDEAYRVAHYKIAQVAEHAWYRAHDIDPAAAEDEWTKIQPGIQHEIADDTPADLYHKEYPGADVTKARHEEVFETAETHLYQGVRSPAVGGLPIGSAQRSEYWTTNLAMAKTYAGPDGFVRVARWNDFPEEAKVTGIDQRGVVSSLKLGEGGKPATVLQVPTIDELPSSASEAQFLSLKGYPSSQETARAFDILRNAPELQPKSAIPMLQEARDLGVIGPTPVRPPIGAEETPAVAAQRAIPAAGPPVDKITMTPAGESIDAWEARFKDWVSRIKEPDDVKPFIEQAAAQNNNFPEARAGAINPAHVEVVAEAAGIDATKIDGMKLSAKFDNPDKIRVLKQALDTTLGDFKDAAAKVEIDPSDANVAKMLEAEIKRDYVVEYALGLRAEWGRAGHALRDLLDATGPSTGLIKEKLPIPPKSVTDVIDNAREFSKNLTEGKEGPLGLDKLVKAASDLVDQTKPKTPGAKAPALPADVAELVKTANAVVKLMDYEKVAAEKVPSVRPLRKLLPPEEVAKEVSPLAKFNATITEGERLLRDGVKEGKPIKAAMPDALAKMVEAAENVTSHFGGVGINRAITDLLARKGRTPEDMQMIAHSLRGLSNEQAARILTDMRGKQQSWYYWVWQQGLISGEVTHSKYVLTNFGFSTLDRVIAPQVASMIGKLHGGEKVFFGEPMVAMYSMLRAVPDATRTSLAAFRSGMRAPLAEELQLADRMTARGEKIPKDLLHTQAVPYGNPGAPNWGIWQRVFNDKQLDVGQQVFGFPGRAASAIHTFFKTLGVRASMEARAYRATAEEGLEPTSNAFNERYSYHRANPTDEALRGGITDGYAGTFMDKLGPMEQRLASAIADTKFRWVFPFMHIPINIVRQTIRYSPAAWMTKEGFADMTGKNGHVAQDLMISKMVIGSSIMGYFFHKALMGEMTGDYPIDPKEREEWKVMGKIPNAIQYNGRWVQLQRLGPAGNLAALGGDFGSLLRHEIDAKDEEVAEKIGNFLGHSIIAAGNMIANETGFQSIRNAVDVAEGRQGLGEAAAYQASTFLPFSSFVRQTASFMDPDMRQAKTLIDGLKASIPGLRETLAPKRDPVFGDPIDNPGYHTVFRGVPMQTDPVKLELDRLKYYPTAPQKEIGRVKLTPEQYDRYEATAGPFVKELLTREINRPGYRNMPDAVKVDHLKGLVEFARGKARQAILHDDPELIQKGIDARHAVIQAHRQ